MVSAHAAVKEEFRNFRTFCVGMEMFFRQGDYGGVRMVDDCEFFLVSSLEKVFPDKRPKELSDTSFVLAKGDSLSFQLVYHQMETKTGKRLRNHMYDIALGCTPLKGMIREVRLVPVEFPATEQRDEFYLSVKPGLYPDLLAPSNGMVKPLPGQYRSLWMTVRTTSCPSGTTTISVSAKGYRLLDGGEKAYEEDDCWRAELSLIVLDAELPPLDMYHTEWFYADCLADYYHVPVWSERHWRIVENFMRFAVDSCGVNLLLTPVFTPPLDTDIGSERTTVQLVNIIKEGESYRFDFGRFRRWCGICRFAGVKGLEIAHLFTQWGAKATPKIMAVEHGQEHQIFGWDVPADAPSYRRFLSEFLPALISEAEAQGYDRSHLFFHLSDEPSLNDAKQYLLAKGVVGDLLAGCTIMDALSDYELYRRGYVDLPIPSTDHIEPFKDKKGPLWTYYCIAQGKLVPNRFIAMDSARNRIMGVLWYMYGISGFLHWGFNFYNSENSRTHIDPFRTTDGNCSFPAGDPFLVYPGPDGRPLSSIRNEVQMDALADLRLLRLLEKREGRNAVLQLIRQGTSCGFSFTDYPRDPEFFLSLRQRIMRHLSANNGQEEKGL